jgi:antitoxin (DNA-binding transcriptional repressor) of toxin-antitoxin stability system
VLSSELDLAHLDARQWTNWWRLLVPPRVLAQPAWALAILESGRLIKLIVTGKGSLDPLPAFPGTKSLAAFARTLGVEAVVAVERDIVAKLSAEIEGALRFDMDYAEQGLVALRAVKKHAGHGIWTEPAILDILPAPSYEPLQRTFDLLVPDRSALVVYIIDDDRTRIHASIIAVKDGGDIVRAGTHRAIADLVPETSFARDWQKQQKRVLQAIEERFAKPSIAVFLERATVMRILTGPSDQLARELNAKHVVIDPAPAWLLGLLGGAAVAAMAGRAASALASMLPQSARDRGRAIAGRAKDALQNSGASPFALLGFDPLELWSRVKHFYRQ